MVPFSWLIECPGLPENTVSSLAFHVGQTAVTLAGSEAVDVRAMLVFDIFLRRQVTAAMITAVTAEPYDRKALEERPGIVGISCSRARICGDWQRNI